MEAKTKFNIFAGASIASLVIGGVWMNDQATWLGGALLVFGFIGTILSAVSWRNKNSK